MTGLEFFSNAIKDTEVDSMLISDSTEIIEMNSKEINTDAPFLTMEMETAAHRGISSAEKTAAWMVLFAKYTNSDKAIIQYSDSRFTYPIYCEINGDMTGKDIENYISEWMDKVENLDDRESINISEIKKEQELQDMPVITWDRSCFDENKADKFVILINEDSIAIRYNTEAYTKTTAERVMKVYECILKGIVSEIPVSEIKLIDEKLTEELDAFHDNEMSYDNSKTVINLIEESIKKYPEKTAVVYRDKRISYKELGEITDSIALYIHSMGIGKEDVVSILIGRSEYMPITAIGVLKAGAAYQPLDPSYPDERLNFMMKDSNAKLLIAEEDLLHKVSEFKGSVLKVSDISALPKADRSINLTEKDSLFILLYTSGSTGVPKGVMLEHRNLVAFINWYVKNYEMNEESRSAAYASFGFDADMMDLYPVLSAGGELHIIEEAIRLELIKLKNYFQENRITHSFMTTQVGRQYAEMFGDTEYPKHLSVGGETLVPLNPPESYSFYNAYGPTECTIFTTLFKVERLYKNIPVGKALDNLHLYVLDSKLNRLPVGMPGELCIAGQQVARGYLNREEQTAAAFVKNPYDSEYPYDRLYRTGDIVRFLSDGRVEFIGRRDSQVKIRGFRIELSEVEEIIRKFKGIKDATVIALEEASGGKYIAAYIVSDEKIAIEELNDFIRANKPPYMVPAVTMQIDKIPLNQNQKVDKKALPKPERLQAELVMPRTEAEKTVYEILKGILQHDEFGITSSFDDSGLTSIGAIRFIVELTKKTGVPVSVQDLSVHKNIEQLAAYLSGAEKDDMHEEREYYPLTQTQMGIYVECLRDPNSVQYNLPGAFRLGKTADIEKLKNAIYKVMDAHRSMKCVISENEHGDIVMYPRENDDFEIEIVNGSESEWDDYFENYAVPFDMKNRLLFRFTLYLTETSIYLVIDFHHIVSDGSSIAVFAEELDRVLKGQDAVGEAFSQYDVAVAEENKRKSSFYKEAKEYYDGIYSGTSASFGIEGDLKEEKEECGSYKLFDERTSRADVEKFCRKNKITENVFFTAVMGYIMGQYNHSEDAVFTTIYNGRNDSRTMNTFAMMVKTLPVYSCFRKDMLIADYMQSIQKQLLDSMKYDIYSFAEISHSYGIKPEIMFVYQGDSFVEFEIGGEKTIFREAVPDKAKANISFNIFVEKGRYRHEFEYRDNIYSRRFIELLDDIYVEAVNSFLDSEKIGEINILSEKEEERIDKFNSTEYPVEIKSVNRLFEEWAEKTPNETAVIACGEKLTYKELNEKANRIANGLLSRGSEKNTLVGLILDRDKNVYITRQGILKAGGGFLPLVAEYPDDRIDFCLRDAACRFVITTEAIKQERAALFIDKPYEVLTVEELIGDESVSCENPDLCIAPTDICYCLYTSGSTGKPKGVLIEHKTLCNFVNSNPKNIEVENYTKNGRVSLAFAAITFDVSVMEEFIPLTNGMTICMANRDEIHNPPALAKLLLDNKVDIMKCTPSFMMSIVDIDEMKEALSRIKAFDIGAEAFPSVLYDKMRAVNPTADIINSYGPTECTVSCTSKLIKSSGNVNIGGPLANMKLYVVNENNRSLPVGISGELIICGDGVGRGYMNLPDKTKEAFFTYKGLPAYHSGDLVKWNDDGEIVFLGRIDNQVKLRGLRIELDEVENAIGSYEGIKSCKVVVKKKGNDEFLAAYYTAAAEIDKNSLTEHISGMLAYYMVPSVMVQLDEMPLTNHGKIDKNRLPEIEYKSAEREYIAPETELEKELCDKYAEVTGADKVSVCDSFFEIGGTSLSAINIIMYCSSKGYNVVYKDIFANPTPRKLADLIAGKNTAGKDVFAVRDYDYSKISELIRKNTFSPDMTISRKKVKKVLLTGVTGFLGIHVLKELIKDGFESIYCLMRKGRFESCEKRLNTVYMYYFGNVLSEEEWNRIVCINADITDSNLPKLFSRMDFDTIINCAACVKHFVEDDLLDRINVDGVKNLISLALSKDIDLVHVSTTSVAGEGNEDTVSFEKQMKENELYFGQIIENDYIRTKFLGERAILEAVCNDGLKAKIMRVGNLMSRREDGEFQINFITNGFMRSLRAYKVLGQFPIGLMHSFAEFSPIDSTAQAIVTLMQCREDYTIFHAYNSHRIYMSDVIYSMNEYGFNIRTVSDNEFAQTLKNAEKDDALSDSVLGLTAYNSSDEKPRYEIASDNRFTAEVLYRMDYKWPITDDSYLLKAIEALDALDFFA